MDDIERDSDPESEPDTEPMTQPFSPWPFEEETEVMRNENATAELRRIQEQEEIETWRMLREEWYQAGISGRGLFLARGPD